MQKLSFRPLALLALVAAAALAGCDDKIKTSDEDIKQVQYKQVREMLIEKDKPAVLVDPRTEKKFNDAHIEGAINIPLAKLIAGDPALADAERIIVYGTTWTDNLSRAAAKKMMALGYQHVYLFLGGVDVWRSEGGKVISATQPAATQGKTN